MRDVNRQDLLETGQVGIASVGWFKWIVGKEIAPFHPLVHHHYP
jgi:hypothetical protein